MGIVTHRKVTHRKDIKSKSSSIFLMTNDSSVLPRSDSDVQALAESNFVGTPTIQNNTKMASGV